MTGVKAGDEQLACGSFIDMLTTDGGVSSPVFPMVQYSMTHIENRIILMFYNSQEAMV